MDNQDVRQTGLDGDFLSENESNTPAKAQQTRPAIGAANGTSSAEESAMAQKRANLVLAILFLAGMAIVYFMSMHNDITEADPLGVANETIVNSAVQQFQADAAKTENAADDGNMNPTEIAREMMTGTSKRQVPLDDLKDNPFVLVPASQSEHDPEETTPVGRSTGVTALQRAEALRLQSIVSTNNRSLAIISDRLVTVGQEIAGWKVEKIGNGQVILKRKDLTYVLRVKQ
ncbi:MAG: hypothetical protein GY794_05925 [bacterium]|nr:hypothetical protein [bacterium]